MTIIIPAAPIDVRETEIYKLLVSKSSRLDGLLDRVDKVIDNASPLLDMVISGPFREYTLHNHGHAKKLVHLAGYIINSETKVAMSCLDCAIIIMSAYIHDLGMSLSSLEKDRILASPEYIDCARSWREAWKRLEETREKLKHASDSERVVFETTIYQLHEAVLARYLRPIHGTKEKYVDAIGTLKTASGRADLFVCGGVSFEDLLIDICISHNEEPTSLLQVMTNFEDRFPRALPLGGVRLNSQYCAAILRISDIIDFDRERTPKALFESLGLAHNSLPDAEVSLKEWHKHMAVHTIELKNDEMLFYADTFHPIIESTIKEFIKYIEREIRDTYYILKKNPPEISDKFKIDLPLTVSAKIRSKGYVYSDLAFRLNETAIIDLLMGEHLYSHPGAALRELIQNSVDAVAVRKEIDPSFIPIIEAKVTKEGNYYWLTVEDNGIGMDENILSGYYFKVGSSYYDSPELAQIIGEKAKNFRPISRFGIGVLSIFMIADLLELTTCHAKSPRGDTKSRTITVEGMGALAFMTESDKFAPGTIVKLRLKEEIQSDIHDAMRSIYNYIKLVLVRPRYDVRVNLTGIEYKFTPDNYISLKPDTVDILEQSSIATYRLDIGRWSEILKGVVIMFLYKSADGKLSLTGSDNKKLLLGMGPLKDVNSLFVSYSGNKVTVNGFRMSLKKLNKATGVHGSIKGLAAVYDIDIVSGSEIEFDVARGKLLGNGATIVRNEIRTAIKKGIEEMGIFEQMTPNTQQLLKESLGAGLRIIADVTLLDRVYDLLPPGEVNYETIKKISAVLGWDEAIVRSSIYTLIKFRRLPSNYKFWKTESVLRFDK